jgi:hypothetical protein
MPNFYWKIARAMGDVFSTCHSNLAVPMQITLKAKVV